MKKKFTLLTVAALSIFVLGACSSGASDSKDTNAIKETNSKSSENSIPSNATGNQKSAIKKG